MGIPPTLNLQSELMLVARVIKISKFFIIPLFFSLLFRAAYSLLLYSSTQHGYFSNKVSPFFSVRYGDALCIFLHLLPTYILIVKGGYLIN
jgi:NADH:ubiquinone oxidoreductase subunit 4 (subunit M)